MDSIVLDERVEGACEMLGLDPLYVAKGLFVAVVNPSIADEFVTSSRKDPSGKDAIIVGEVVKEHPGKVVIRSRVGGRRVVGMMAGEQLPRIC